ncbi:MAG: hypothetical protein LH631_10335 [Alkalinema sp. CAN_BIN05]|nr:hypothetical protein [Alkalinema sp. CAN_BIN05]
MAYSWSLSIFRPFPLCGRMGWLREAIAEKLRRENQFVSSSAESKAIDRIAMPIGEDEWITIGTLDQEFDLE